MKRAKEPRFSLVFHQLDTARVVWENGTVTGKKNTPIRLAYTVGKATTRALVVLGCMKKKPEQTMRSKPVSSIPPWYLLQWLLLMIDRNF